ncbi:hypothetical protein MUN88_17035 [Gracilibacillus caseinilyticus]|uniref:Phage tail protein n=1 Tax=Gracilibacillus caseinilyticus TaxID=2932256 RepID=A0ABY4ETI9_9BACI|nr:hypothetical protein [Gracilibacillus caseinilyticus]UOQ47737.1 hypothetical protein MUN88_17035 [Gracilibacillus caseinilyticus]
MAEEQEILFGTGDLFIVTEEDDGSGTMVEVETKIGLSNGEAALNIEYETVDVRGDKNNKLLKVFKTSENITFNAGIITYDLKEIGNFLDSKFTEDEVEGTRKLELGGDFKVNVNKLKFVHYKEDGKTITMTMHKATNVAGLEWTFNNEEATSFPFEFRLMHDSEKNNTVEIVEEI